MSKIQQTLFDLTTDQLHLKDELEIACEASMGDVTDEIEDLIDRLSAGQVGLEEKFAGYLAVIAELETEEKGLRGTVDGMMEVVNRLKGRANIKATTVSALKSRMLGAMSVLEIKKIETPLGNITASVAGQAPLEVDDNLDMSELDDRFVVVKESLNNIAIKNALKAGEELTWARLGERKTFLRIS